ncbi:M56 family metallopeptidase [Aquimarina gracilis]|uniref:M56 family metallopeptidase n=1 Tax=Aquimarina gracilis TaxID=874422 RepID=A0ABU5ZTX2_9FLAO|nr:M56 family metallopeptidase [Aquimarina gracilis]MEB3344716.1 M56 family metallopeptidase [Aquimarina gracilis]
METTLIYLLKVNLLISIFYLTYFLLLKRDTFFNINRHFFILGIIISILLPLVEFSEIIYIENPNTIISKEIPTTTQEFVLPNTISEVNQINWWFIGGIIYGLGLFLFSIRFSIQLISLSKLLNSSRSRSKDTFRLIEINQDIAPFSFFKYIVYNPTLHSDKELRMILKHEMIHAKQHHTIDLLLANLLTVVLWYNPFMWLYKKSLEQNLEFIADQETIKEVSSPKEYQLTMVNISSNHHIAITNNFYQSLIKKRILMINKQPSKRLNIIKFGIILPILSLFLWSFNTKEVIKYKTEKSSNEKQTEFVLDSTKPYMGSLSKDITKESTIEELKEFKNFVKEYFNVEIEFDNIDFKDNLISQMSMKFEDTYGNKGSFKSDNGNEYIRPVIFKIRVNQNGKTEEIGFFRPESALDSVIVVDNGENINQFTSLGESPIYIVNGTQYEKSQLIGKTFLTNKKIMLFIGKNAVSKYGKKAKDGVVVLENATPWKSMTTRIDDQYRKEHEKAHLIGITSKNPELVFAQFKK